MKYKTDTSFRIYTTSFDYIRYVKHHVNNQIIYTKSHYSLSPTGNYIYTWRIETITKEEFTSALANKILTNLIENES